MAKQPNNTYTPKTKEFELEIPKIETYSTTMQLISDIGKIPSSIATVLAINIIETKALLEGYHALIDLKRKAFNKDNGISDIDYSSKKIDEDYGLEEGVLWQHKFQSYLDADVAFQEFITTKHKVKYRVFNIKELNGKDFHARSFAELGGVIMEV